MIDEQTSRPSTENRMNKNQIQFIKDGLVGVAAAGLMYVPITLAVFFLTDIYFFSVSYVLGQISCSVMPSFCLFMFLSVGVNGRFIKNITTRRGWRKPILKMLSVSLLVVFFFTFTCYPLLSIPYPTELLTVFYMFGILGGDILLAFGIAYLLAVVFNPKKRRHRLRIPVMASIFFLMLFGWLVWETMLLTH